LSLKPAKPTLTKGVGLGAAMLMATSAIGPGFLTQTTVFTQQLLSSFGFVIFITLLLDIGAQLNIWRILVVSESKAQDVANTLLPGLGYVLAALVILGGFAFNIANVGGAGLGLRAMLGFDVTTGALITGTCAIAIFWFNHVGQLVDKMVKIFALIMIVLTLIVAVIAHPPMAQVIQHTFIPQQTSALAVVTLVGGTVGGYISFAGAHRLLDGGLRGTAALPLVDRSAVTGIVITSIMRFSLFIAALGVITAGTVLDAANPTATVFGAAAGQVGYRFFGVVMWCASITSVIGAAYTSVSFLTTFHPLLLRYNKWLVTVFIVSSTMIFVLIGKPVSLLVAAGAINGFILPAGLAIVLLAAARKRLMGSYKHPVWLQIAGWLVVLAVGWLALKSFYSWLA